jgi:hypothetical protein
LELTSGSLGYKTELEAVTDKTGLEFSKNSILLTIKQDFAEDRTPSI